MRHLRSPVEPWTAVLRAVEGGASSRMRACRSCAWALLACLLSAGCFSWAPVRAKALTPREEIVAGGGSYTWRADGGWVKPVRGTWGTPESTRSEAMKAFDAEAYADALEGFLHVQEALPPKDPSRATIHLHMAECYRYLGNYDKAVQYYRQVYRGTPPDEATLNRAFQGIYDISMDYLRGAAGRAFLIKGLADKGPSYGVELLTGSEGLITEYPYLPFADDALMEVARRDYEDKDYTEAARLYRRVVEEYPGREWKEEAQFQLAMSTMKQIRGIDYEMGMIQDAARSFRRYLDENPRGKQAAEARARLQELTEMQGESCLRIAKFYLRESQVRAAKIYLQVVLERYTATPAAREAREIMRKLDRVQGGS